MKIPPFKSFRFTAGLTCAALLIFSVAAVMPSVHAHLHGHAADSHHAEQGSEAFCGMQNHAAIGSISTFETRFDLTLLAAEAPVEFESLVIPGISSPLHSRAPPSVSSFA